MIGSCSEHMEDLRNEKTKAPPQIIRKPRKVFYVDLIGCNNANQ